MKKTIAIAGLGLLGSFVGGKTAEAIIPVKTVEVSKQASVSPEDRKKKRSGFAKRPVLDPSFPTMNHFFPIHTSPFFNPTRSQRVKNKLNRKYYRK